MCPGINYAIRRFNKLEITNSNILTYNFKDNNDSRASKDFLEVLKNKFNDKIYQVDKVIKNNLVVRELKYKIEIIDIGKNFIKLTKYEINKNGKQ